MLTHTRRALTAALLVACGSCVQRPLQTFPPPARPSQFVNVSPESLWRAVREYAELQALPIEDSDQNRRILTTGWQRYGPGDVDFRDHADCAGALAGVRPPELRVRYRISVGRRGDRSSLQIHVHWQHSRPIGFEEDAAWTDCRSTGEWERMLASRLALRASNMR